MQIFFKNSIEDMMSGFYCLQVCCFFSFYTVNIPANSEIYTGEFRKLISFDAIKPDRLLQLYDPNLSVDKLVGASKETMTGAIESSGISSTNFLSNMSTYLFALAIIVALLIMLAILSFFGGRIGQMAKKSLKDKLGKTFFNGKIKV